MGDYTEEITHSGYIEIGDVKMYALVTKSGKRLITASDVFSAIGKSRRGDVRVEGLPAFIGAKNLLPFIDDDLYESIQPIRYRAKNGRIATAYDATIIPKVADLYVSAYEVGSLTKSQEPVYERALMMIRALAKVGIVALIDEATGFQYDRDSKNLQKLLSAYISKDLMKWQARFPIEFYEQIYRLYGISTSFDPNNPKRPQWIGNFTNKYVYGIFPDDVMNEIKKRNPIKESARGTVFRGHKHFQHLTENIGIPQLDKHLAKLIGVMVLSENIHDFEKNFQKAFHTELDRKRLQDDIKNGINPLF
ncbi:P63C domain-containing protein [Listeria kieliensis]